MRALRVDGAWRVLQYKAHFLPSLLSAESERGAALTYFRCCTHLIYIMMSVALTAKAAAAKFELPERIWRPELQKARVIARLRSTWAFFIFSTCYVFFYSRFSDEGFCVGIWLRYRYYQPLLLLLSARKYIVVFRRRREQSQTLVFRAACMQATIELRFASRAVNYVKIMQI